MLRLLSKNAIVTSLPVIEGNEMHDPGGNWKAWPKADKDFRGAPYKTICSNLAEQFFNRNLSDRRWSPAAGFCPQNSEIVPTPTKLLNLQKFGNYKQYSDQQNFVFFGAPSLWSCVPPLQLVRWRHRWKFTWSRQLRVTLLDKQESVRALRFGSQSKQSSPFNDW